MCRQHGKLGELGIFPKVNKKKYCAKVNTG